MQLMKRKDNSAVVTLISEKCNVPVIVWNNVMDCNEDCLICDTCTVKKEEKCAVMRDYISNVLNSAITVHGSYLNEKDMVSIGMLIIPLYSQLFKLKIMEKSLGMKDMLRFNKQGTWSMHPVYREIRDCVKSIESMWNRVGMKNFAMEKDGRDIFTGDNDYYEQISGNSAE